MKKFFLSLFILSAAALSSFAQTTNKGQFSIGFEGMLPLGSGADVYSVGIGGSFKYDHPIGQNLFLTGSAGYTKLFLTDETKAVFRALDAPLPKIGFLPVKAGLKYFFTPGFFAEAQAGAAFAVQDATGTSFVFSPGVGYSFSRNFEAGFRYEGWSDEGEVFNQLGLRIAYKF